MCGITGWFGTLSAQPAEAAAALERMVQALAHRGPDGRGSLILGDAALGHTRLAIIDLHSGQQPMTDTQAAVSIVFNGEIYNYRELRDDLIARGFTCATNSDTEVILKLYRCDGVAGFARLRGMYAFAIWDAEKRVGILARDPLGIKPLFVVEGPDGLVFGSEAKAILARGDIKARLDEPALHLLMNYRYLPGKYTLFRDITQLPPGQVLMWRSTGSSRIENIAPVPAPSGDTVSVLSESVAAHLIADVEVGAYLSGGIDSAAVAALARPYCPRLRTFTVELGDDPMEASNAAETASLLHLHNEQLAVDGKAAEMLPALIRHLEVPKVNALQVALLAKATRSQVKVALSGLGGDELFLGYNLHRWLWQLARLERRVPRLVTQAIGETAAGLLRVSSKAMWSEPERASHALAAIPDWPRVYGLLRNLWDSERLRRQIYGPRLLDQSLPDAWEDLRGRWPDESEPVLAAARFERREKMVNDLLWNEDRCSMAVGLEVRVPFVDGAVAAHVSNLPLTTLMPAGRPKGYLRSQLAGILPPAVMNRPKSGFQIDAPSFFREHLMGLARELLCESTVHRFGLFNPKFVRWTLALPAAQRHRWHYFILLLMLGTHMWMMTFEDSGTTPHQPAP